MGVIEKGNLEKIFGDYLILRHLGRGPWGQVYLSEHRFLKKKFAIKILSKELSSDLGFIERLERDVGFLANLDHPSIVKLHNISSVDGRFFLVMDPYVTDEEESSNLGRLLCNSSQGLSEKEIEQLLFQLASALDYVHQLPIEGGGLSHRGLKPTNFFVIKKEQGLSLFLSDFGLTPLVGEKRAFVKNLERFAGEIEEKKGESLSLSLPSFPFLAPEQREWGRSVDSKADIYAFGVLAYYLLTRNFPEGYFELPTQSNPQLELPWNAFICQCLHRDPAKRPARLVDTLQRSLYPTSSSPQEKLSWAEVEKKVDHALQTTFVFLQEDKLTESKKSESLAGITQGPPRPILSPTEIHRPQYDPNPAAAFYRDPMVSLYHPKKEELKDVIPLLTEMMIIPRGTYCRGNDKGPRDESPFHRVVLSPFAVDVHQVTNEQFARFLEAMGGEKDVNNNDIIRLRNSRIKRSNGRIIVESGYSKHPVVGVTWYGAVAYAKWVGKRLPTEAEWEVACSGGQEEMIYPNGKNVEHTQANFFSSDTTAVMSYPPNGFGLYDMIGNVYEWCQDWYAYNYYDASAQEPEDPKGPPQGVYRVLRGGCWKSLKEDLRCSHRHRNNPGAVNSTYGFRCAADVSGDSSPSL